MSQETNANELIEAGKQFAFSLCQNYSDAEDLAQQSWMKLQAKYGEVSNKKILFTSIRNLWFDQLRRKRVVSFSPIENAPEPHLSENYGYSLDMETALTHLSPREKESLFLNVVEGYTAREIGEKLKMPRGTILCHLTRARAKLKKIFSQEFERLPEAALS